MTTPAETSRTSEKGTVLVTGGAGFIGVHAILQLLESGHRVRATLRSLSREGEVRAMLKVGGCDAGDRLSFAVADLGSDANWTGAVQGCQYVLHVASPTPAIQFTHEDELIKPARDGVLRVLRAARDAGVQRVVLTSASGAILTGHAPRTEPFTEADWSNLDGDDVPAYQKSKTLAERAAWDFIASEGRSLELSVINPVAVLGPVLGPDYSHSIGIVKNLLDGAMPGCPKISNGFVDVRDVVDLHLRAMRDPAAKGERFLAVSGDTLSILDMARVLKRRTPALAGRVPTREIPSWVVKLAALRTPSLKMMLPHLDKVRHTTSAKAQRLLGWKPRPNEESIVDTAESLARLGLLKSQGT